MTQLLVPYFAIIIYVWRKQVGWWAVDWTTLTGPEIEGGVSLFFVFIYPSGVVRHIYHHTSKTTKAQTHSIYRHTCFNHSYSAVTRTDLSGVSSSTDSHRTRDWLVQFFHNFYCPFRFFNDSKELWKIAIIYTAVYWSASIRIKQKGIVTVLVYLKGMHHSHLFKWVFENSCR